MLNIKYAGFKDLKMLMLIFPSLVSQRKWAYLQKLAWFLSSLASFYKVSKTGAENNKAIV